MGTWAQGNRDKLGATSKVPHCAGLLPRPPTGCGWCRTPTGQLRGLDPSFGEALGEQTKFHGLPTTQDFLLRLFKNSPYFFFFYFYFLNFVFIQLLSCVGRFATSRTGAGQAPLSFTISRSLLRFVSAESVTLSNHLILCHPLLLLAFSLSQHQGLFHESALCIMWPKYWSFSCSIRPFNEYSGLISFRMDWLDLLAAQGTLKSLLQHHSSKASIPRCSAFFWFNSHIHL